jgi:hypothetical protein
MSISSWHSERPQDTSEIKVGQRIHCILYGGRDGVIFNIRGQQDPGSIRQLGGGCVVMGGRASFDVVFEDGTESKGVPEGIVRGVQWRIFPEVATEQEIATMRRAAILKQQADDDERKRNAEEFAAAVQALRADPKYAHLKQTAKDAKLYGCTLAASNIRTELKLAFPGVKFSVRSDKFSGGDSVDVTWTDGPTCDQVKRIIGKYAAGTFDGMTDSYDYESRPWTTVFGDAKYVQSSRAHSREALEAAVAKVKAEFKLEEPERLDVANGWVSTPSNHDQRLVNDCLELRGWFDPARNDD